MSHVKGIEVTGVDTTGEVVATGGYGNGQSPNELLVKVSGDALLGGAEADALVPITADDGFVPINLKTSEELWIKSAAGTVTVWVFGTQIDS